MGSKALSRRAFLRGLAVSTSGIGMAVLAGCKPQVVEVTKIVKEVVKETVIVAGTPKVVEKEVTKIIEKKVEVTKVVEKKVEKVVTATPAPKEPVQLVHYDRNIPQDVEFRKDLAERFHEKHPDIIVKVEVMPEGYQQTIQARVASRTAGDVWRWGAHFGMGKFVLRGMFYSLDEFVEQDGYDLSVFFPGAIKANTMEGKLWALPVNGHPGWSGLYYMPEMFAEAGIDEPTDEWTYDDVVAAALKLTKDTDGDGKTDVYGYWQNGNFPAHLTPLSAFGGWAQNDDGTKATYDTPESRAGIQWIYDVYNKYKVAVPNPAGRGRLELWGSNKVAMVLSGIWDGSYLRDATPEGKTMKLAPGPIGPSGERGGAMGANCFPIWRSSEHPYEAWLWNKYICSKEVGIENVDRIGEPGLRFDAWEDPILANDPMVAPHYGMLKVCKPQPEPANSRTTELRQEVGQVLSGIWIQELTVDEGVAMLQEKTQEILDRPRPGL